MNHLINKHLICSLPTYYFNCYSCIKKSVGALPDILGIYPWVNLLSVVIPSHGIDLKTARFCCSAEQTCFPSKLINYIMWIPVIMYHRISMAHILVPNHSIWSSRWILVIVKTAWDDKAGAHQSFNMAGQLHIPSTGTTNNETCEGNIMQKDN